MTEKRPVGRPSGWSPQGGKRDQHQIRAHADEWQLIKKFAEMVKHGNKKVCSDFIELQS